MSDIRSAWILFMWAALHLQCSIADPRYHPYNPCGFQDFIAPVSRVL